ncbi:MAG: DUF1553 domain-containing protein, partial [Verrucomicrobiae bacterium]|nr:DUF1553 domain-containing protein [Verrucomicrobiae bacterium]
TMSVQEEAEPGDWHLHIRGQIRKLGPVVPRGFLSVIDERTAEIAAGESGRRELAAWLTRPENPLTARVMINRVWRHLFGGGLVRTTENFGTTGDPPTHRELLDWLAVRFVDQGWSVKAAIREIVQSRTYRLSSQASDAAMRSDPSNFLLSHANRRRLDAEVLRDAMLVVSARLESVSGGPTMRPGTKSELGYRFESKQRSIY